MALSTPPSENRPSRLIDIVMDIPFFDMLNAQELTEVVKHMNYFEIEKGDVLFKEGDPGDSVCFVVDGALDVFKEGSKPGQIVHIATINKNRAIGEMAVIDEYTRSATVTARHPSAIVSLGKSAFDTLLQENPRIGAAILKRVAKLVSMNLRRTSSQLADHLVPIEEP